MIPLFQHPWFLFVLALVATTGEIAGTATPASGADRAADQYRVSAFHYSRGEWSEAVKAFDEFLTEHPSHPRVVNVQFYRGESLIQLSRPEDAIRAYTLFLSQAPQHDFAAHAEFRLAECYFLAGRHEAAAQAFAAYEKKYPESELITHAWPYLAEISAKQENWEEAVQQYERAIQAAPTPAVAAEARLGQARAYGKLQKWSDAARAYRKLLADLKETESKLPAGSIALEAGIAEFRRGSFRRAVAHFESVAKHEPQLADQADFWIAKTHFQVRDWPHALEPLRKLLKSGSLPDFQDEIHYLTAKIHLEQGAANQALPLLTHQLATWPKSAWADESLFLLLTLHLENDDTDAAQSIFEQLRGLDQATLLAARAQLALATHLQRHREHEAALAVLGQTIAGETPADLAQRNAYLKAVSLVAQNRLDEAEQILKQRDTAENESSQGHARMLLGLVHSQRDQWNEAVAAYQAALEAPLASEQQSLARLGLATALLHLSKFDEAKAAWQAADRTALPTEQYLGELAQIAGAAYRTGQHTWASQLFEELARDGNPKSYVEQGLAGLAWCRMATSPEAATEVLDELLAKNPGSPLAVGALYQQAQQAETADAEVAIARYRQLLEHHASDALAGHARLRLAALLDKRGDDAEAETLLIELTEQVPTDLPAEDIWYRLAWVRLDLKKQDEAIQAFERIHDEHRVSPLWEDATYRLAEFALHAGNQEQARIFLGDLLLSEPPTRITHFGRYMLGQIEVQAGNWEAAQPLMDEVVKQVSDQPLQSMAMFWGAEARFRLAKFDEAKIRYEQLLTQTMGRELESQPVAEMRLAQISAHQDDWDAAYERAKAIGKKYPDFDQAHELDYLRGRCLARLGHFDEARAAYAEVLAAPGAAGTETAAMAQWMMGETYFHQKNYDAAVRAYAQVGAVHGNFPKWKAAALLQIGKCHEVQESWEKATQYYTEVHTQFGQTPFAPEAETRLSVVRQRTGQARIDSTRTQ